MKKYVITVYRRSKQHVEFEFMQYEFMQKDLAENALRSIISEGCWKNIPQKKSRPPCDALMRVYLPPHEICKIQYVEREI
jgi:hypothetical protein